MLEMNKIVFNEIINILDNSEDIVREKIPKKLINFFTENQDNSCTVNINFDDHNWKNNIHKETEILMALLYRDYIISKERRKELILEEEKEYNKKYSYKNLFKDKNNNIIINENKSSKIKDMQLIEVKKISIFKKIINKIKNILK